LSANVFYASVWAIDLTEEHPPFIFPDDAKQAVPRTEPKAGTQALPDAATSGAPAVSAPQSAIVLRGRDEDVIVRGKVKRRLIPGQYRVVKTLIDAFPERVPLDTLTMRSKTSDPVEMIDRLRKDEDWATVLDKPGQAHRGYGIRTIPPRSRTPRKKPRNTE
jgi:hypothetical protein